MTTKNDFIKLTNAVYKLLEFFPEADPLKIRSKEKALAILENLTLVFNDEGWVSIGEFLAQNREKAKLEILEDIKVLLNYFEVAKSQKWLSDVNFLIISNGYEKIKEKVGFPIIVENPAPKPEEVKTIGVQFLLSDRQSRIIQFLKNNEKAQVADLIKVLPKITKRTIRRDLDELMKLGKITRLGEYNQVFYKIGQE